MLVKEIHYRFGKLFPCLAVGKSKQKPRYRAMKGGESDGAEVENYSIKMQKCGKLFANK